MNKRMFAIAAGLVLTSASIAHADSFKSCPLELATHQFVDCQGGVNSNTCRAEKVLIGNAVVELDVASASSASGTLSYTDASGAKVTTELKCALITAHRQPNDMSCVSVDPLSTSLGSLTLSFNSASAPYYVVAFVGTSNAPNGAFSTADCASK